MKKFLFLSFFIMFSMFSAIAAELGSAKVTVIQSPDGRPCFFFMLDGANGTSKSQWYGISTSNTGYKEAVAMLMMAVAGSRDIQISTSADKSCGTDVVIASRIFIR